jgi:proteic killer suppression protein
MIRSIRHKGLKRLHEDDDARGVITEHVEKLRDILARLDAASSVADMDLPGLHLHALKGDLKAFGRSRFAPTGAWFSGLPTATCWTSITSTTTKGGKNHGDEESPPPWRLCIPPVH